MKHNSITNAISKDSPSKEEVTRAHENPIRHESFQPLSFSLKDVKATMIHEAGGSNKMNKNQQNIIEHLQRMDEDGDGTISLLEIIYMEKKFQKSKNQQKKLKFLVMSMFFVFILMMLSFFAMAVWAVEITKETRAAGGNTLSKPASSSDIPPMEQTNRGLRPSILNGRKLSHETVAISPNCRLGETRSACDKRVSMETETQFRTSHRNSNGVQKEVAKAESISKYCNDCILELKSFRRRGDLSRQESGSCARCPACFEVLPNGKITSLPSSTCKTVDRIIIDGETGAEKIQTTLSTDMNIYGNTPTYPLSYNYNVLRFRTERCLNAKVQPGQLRKTAEVCTAEQAKKMLESMPVFVNPSLRYVALDRCIRAELYESCREIIIKSFDNAREVKFPAKVFYDVSRNPNVCGTTMVHIGNEDKCNIYDSNSAEVAELELLSDGAVFINFKMLQKLTKTFVEHDLMSNDCTSPEVSANLPRDHKFYIPKNRLKFIMSCSASPVKAFEEGFSKSRNEHGPADEIFSFKYANFPVGNELDHTVSKAKASLQRSSANPNLPDIDKDSFVVTIKTALEDPSCTSADLQFFRCFNENTRSAKNGSTVRYEEKTVWNNHANGVTIVKRVRASSKTFGKAENLNKPPILNEERVEIFQRFSGCGRKDRYTAFTQYRYDLHKGDKPIGIKINEDGYLLCLHDPTMGEEEIPCGEDVEKYEGNGLRPNVFQIGKTYEISSSMFGEDIFEGVDRRRLHQKLESHEGREDNVEILPLHQLDKVESHLKRNLAFADVSGKVLYTDPENDDVLLETCIDEQIDIKNQILGGNLRRLAALKLHEDGRQGRKATMHFGHVAYSLHHHLSGAITGLGKLHGKLKGTKHGRQLSGFEHLRALLGSHKTIHLNTSSESMIMTEILGTWPPEEGFKPGQVGSLVYEYDVAKLAFQSAQSKFQEAKEKVCFMQKAEATLVGSERISWASNFNIAVKKEIDKKVALEIAQTHFDEIKRIIEIVYTLVKFPKVYDRAQSTMKQMVNVAEALYDDYVQRCSTIVQVETTDCTEDTTHSREWHYLEHTRKSEEKLSRIINGVKALRKDLKKAPSTCQFFRFGQNSFTSISHAKFYDLPSERENILNPIMVSQFPLLEIERNNFNIILPSFWDGGMVSIAEKSYAEQQAEEAALTGKTADDHRSEELYAEMSAKCAGQCYPKTVANGFLSFPSPNSVDDCKCARLCSDNAISYKRNKEAKIRQAISKLNEFSPPVCSTCYDARCPEGVYKVKHDYNERRTMLDLTKTVRFDAPLGSTCEMHTPSCYSIHERDSVACAGSLDLLLNTNACQPGMKEGRVACDRSATSSATSNAFNGAKYNNKVLPAVGYLTKTFIQMQNHGFCLKNIRATSNGRGHIAMSRCNPDSSMQKWKYSHETGKISTKFGTNLTYCLTANPSASSSTFSFYKKDMYLTLEKCRERSDQIWDYHYQSGQIRMSQQKQLCLMGAGNKEKGLINLWGCFCHSYNNDETLCHIDSCSSASCARRQSWYIGHYGNQNGSPVATKYSLLYEKKNDLNMMAVRLEHGLFVGINVNGPADKICFAPDTSKPINVGPFVITFKDTNPSTRNCATVDAWDTASSTGRFRHNLDDIEMLVDESKAPAKLRQILQCGTKVENEKYCKKIESLNGERFIGFLKAYLGWDVKQNAVKIKIAVGKGNVPIPCASDGTSIEDDADCVPQGDIDMATGDRDGVQVAYRFWQKYIAGVGIQKSCTSIMIKISADGSMWKRTFKSRGCPSLPTNTFDYCKGKTSATSCIETDTQQYGNADNDPGMKCQWHYPTQQCFNPFRWSHLNLDDGKDVLPLQCKSDEILCPSTGNCLRNINGQPLRSLCKSKCDIISDVQSSHVATSRSGLTWSGERKVCIEPSIQNCHEETFLSASLAVERYAYCDSNVGCVKSTVGCTLDCFIDNKPTIYIASEKRCAGINPRTCSLVGLHFCKSSNKCVSNCVSHCKNTVANMSSLYQACELATKELCTSPKNGGYNFCDSNDFNPNPECVTKCASCAGGNRGYNNSNSVCQSIPDCNDGAYCPLSKNCVSTCQSCEDPNGFGGNWSHGWKDNETHISGALSGQITCKAEAKYLAGWFKCIPTGKWVEHCQGSSSIHYPTAGCKNPFNGTYLYFGHSESQTCQEADVTKCASIGLELCDQSTRHDGYPLTTEMALLGKQKKKFCISDCYSCYYEIATNVPFEMQNGTELYALALPTHSYYTVHSPNTVVDKFINLDHTCMTLEMSQEYAVGKNKSFCPPSNIPDQPEPTPWIADCSSCRTQRSSFSPVLRRTRTPSNGGMCLRELNFHCPINAVECPNSYGGVDCKPLVDDTNPWQEYGCFFGCQGDGLNQTARLEKKLRHNVINDALFTRSIITRSWWTCEEANEEFCRDKGMNFCPLDKTCRHNTKQSCHICGGLSDPPGSPSPSSNASNLCQNRSDLEAFCANNGKFFCDSPSSGIESGRCVDSCSSCNFVITTTENTDPQATLIAQPATGLTNDVRYSNAPGGRCVVEGDCPANTFLCLTSQKSSCVFNCYSECDNQHTVNNIESGKSRCTKPV